MAQFLHFALFIGFVMASQCVVRYERLQVMHKPRFGSSFGLSSKHMVEFAVFDLYFDLHVNATVFDGSELSHMRLQDVLDLSKAQKMHVPDFIQLECQERPPIAFSAINATLNFIHQSIEYPLYSHSPHLFLVDGHIPESSPIFPPIDHLELLALRIVFPFKGKSHSTAFTHIPESELDSCRFHLKPLFTQISNFKAEIVTSATEIQCKTERVDFPRKTIVSGFKHPNGNCDEVIPSSFIEVQAYQEMLTGIINMAAKVMIGVFMENVNLQIDPGAISKMTKDLNEACKNDVPPLVLGPMKEYLANMVVDNVVHQTTKYLTISMTENLGPFITERVVDNLMRNLEPPLAKFLVDSIGGHITENLPLMLESALGHQLIPRLSRSLTHSIVATVTHAMYDNGRSSEVLLYCRICYETQAMCNKCPHAPQTSYYVSYYSTYYAEYFVEYYADYYYEAFVGADQRTNQYRMEKSFSKSHVKL